MNQLIIIIMTKIFKDMACAFVALSFAACSGDVDNPEGTLRIFADKVKISADGNDEVTFKVMFGSEDVSNAKTLQIIRIFDGEEKYMSYGANKFSTVTAGTYKFRAKYYYGGNYMTDNEVTVVAEPYFSGEEKNYKRRYFGTLFTSTGCAYCPSASIALKELQADFPGEISVAAFHSDLNKVDPMTIPETQEFNAALGGSIARPLFFWNMKKETIIEGGADKPLFLSSFTAEEASYETFSGVAVRTTLDQTSNKLDIEVGITSNIPSVFRYQVILVEDKIPAVDDYAQDVNNPSMDMSGYLHNNVVRTALTGARGDKINENLPLTVGVEAKASESATLSPDWKIENMRVIVTAMISEDGGFTWLVNNVNECKVGESVSYLYE